MIDKKSVEQQIRAILDTENDAHTLGNKLFSPDGLFIRLAKTEAERRHMTQSSLFREAQRKLSDLQHQEAAELSKIVRQAQKQLPGDEHLVKIERM